MWLNPKMALLDMLLPRRCLVCRANIVQEIICEACLSLCNTCPNPTWGQSASHYGALFYYELTIKEIIRRAKFERSPPMAHLLLALTEQALIKSELLPQIVKFAPDAIAFVPAHWTKRLAYSVHLPLLFAQAVGRITQVPVANILCKNRGDFTQSSVSSKKQRIEEIKGVFSAKPVAAEYKKILLVDDIVTSGATFDETRKMLHNQRNKLRCIAIAKTP